MEPFFLFWKILVASFKECSSDISSVYHLPENPGVDTGVGEEVLNKKRSQNLDDEAFIPIIQVSKLRLGEVN